MKGDKSKNKCKKCGTVMIASSDPFLATIFGGRGKVAAKKLSQFTKCPKCGQKGIERLE
jgi:predicted RNA-binding Zn-ribbon protein involved in translation (DUF1610 family)